MGCWNRGLSLTSRTLALKSDSAVQICLRAAWLQAGWLYIQPPLLQATNESCLEGHTEITLAPPTWICRSWRTRQQLTHRKKSPTHPNLNNTPLLRWQSSGHKGTINCEHMCWFPQWQLWLPSRKKITSKMAWNTIRAELKSSAKELNVNKLPGHTENF